MTRLHATQPRLQGAPQLAPAPPAAQRLPQQRPAAVAPQATQQVVMTPHGPMTVSVRHATTPLQGVLKTHYTPAAKALP